MGASNGSGLIERNSYPNRNRTVQIDTLELTGKNMSVNLFETNHLVQLNIYESIFSNYITGNISILDNSGMFEKMPVCGDEILQVSFKPATEFPGPNFTKTFRVFKCSDVTTAKGSKTRTYTLEFCSMIAFDNYNARIRRAYKGMTQDQIVSDICTNVLNVEVDIKDTAKYPHDIVIPAWKPLYAINYLAKTAVRSSGYPASNFLFYENKDGFVFDSLDRNISTSTPPNVLDFHISRASDPRAQAKVWNCREYTLDEPFDIIKSASTGMFGHRLHAHDIIKKKVLTYDYIYESEFDAHKHLKENPKKLSERISSFPEQKISFGPRQEKERYESEHTDDYTRRRSPMLRQIGHYPLQAITEGNTNVTCGERVRFDLVTNQSQQNELDETLSKNCILTDLKHTITNKEHTMLCQLSTESISS